MPSGSSAVRAGALAGTPGNTAHVWGTPAGVFTANASDFGGLFIAVTARLVPDDPTKAFNFANAKYLLGVGADLEPMPDGTGWARFGYGRGKWVSATWETHYFINWTKDQILADPPLLE